MVKMSDFMLLTVIASLVLVMQGSLATEPCRFTSQTTQGSPNETTNVTVPFSCKSGTFVWNNPKGHAMLDFENHQAFIMTVCLVDSSDVFEMFDVSLSDAKALRSVVKDSQLQKCAYMYDSDIVVRLDAPEVTHDVGEVTFTIHRNIII